MVSWWDDAGIHLSAPQLPADWGRYVDGAGSCGSGHYNAQSAATLNISG